jgi:hypothetical protein
VTEHELFKVLALVVTGLALGWFNTRISRGHERFGFHHLCVIATFCAALAAFGVALWTAVSA